MLPGFLAATGLGSHDPEHPFAGNWTISFQAAATATFSFGLVGDAEGLAAMNAIFATGPCENKFSARVKPGACLRRVFRNPTDAKLTMRVYDDRFSGDRVRLAVTILPA